MKVGKTIPQALYLLVAFLIIGCNHNVDEPMSSAPQIDIMSPSATDSPFRSGERVLIQVDFSDDVELHEMAVFIQTSATDEPVYQRNLHKHGNTYRWIEDTAFFVSTITYFNIIAVATDHELQRTEKSQHFTVEP